MTLSDESGSMTTADYPFAVVRLPRQLVQTLALAAHHGRSSAPGAAGRPAVCQRAASGGGAGQRRLRKPLVQKVVGDLAWERATGRGWVHESSRSSRSGAMA